ncbi:MAG: nickel/cobalt efflux transporter RcnA [Fibrobacteres bacterium]|nr:nickel/cobalt efflux transporter RcnA [Fibrobacterota bacterium]
MTDFVSLLQSGNAWLFIPSAVLLGALHGMEPGHSKTMMAAFIVAVRGTVLQAVLLGLATTISHTAIVWAVAMLGLWLGSGLDIATVEPWLQVASGILIFGIATWMLGGTLRDQRRSKLQVRVVKPHGHPHPHPHSHDAHDHTHPHPHPHSDEHGNDSSESGYEDAHERAHAAEIGKRFATQDVSTGQIVAFGLTGGLIPCPASVTVLLLCLQLKKFALGATLVLSFSVGLALTMVASGVIAALSLRHASRRWKGFGAFASKLPYLSGILILLVGLYVFFEGLHGLGVFSG